MSRAAVGRERATRGLFERWQRDKDPRARECLAERYLPLARTLAARYRGRGGEPFDDLLQVASLGLLKAIDRFDPDRGTAFSSFAVPTILGELKRYFRDTGWSAHVPRGAQELALKVQEAEQAISPRLGRSPTADELALYMEVSVEQVLDGLEAAAAHHATSLEEPHDELDGESQSLADALGEDDPRFEQIDASLTVASAARELSEREQRVLELRFYGELTQSEIAKRIGVSQMQVSRILRGALAHLRELALAEDDPHQPVKSAGTEDGNPGGCFLATPRGATPGLSVSRRATRDRAEAPSPRRSRVVQRPGVVGMLTSPSGEQAPPAASPLLEIANVMVHLYKDAFGRGPSKARAQFSGSDTLVVLLADMMTIAERQLVALGEHARVRAQRLFLQLALEDKKRSEVERILKRRALACVSGTDPDRDLAAEVFLLEPHPAGNVRHASAEVLF